MTDDQKLREKSPRAPHRYAQGDESILRYLQAGGMKLIILDRDGVINYDSDEFIKHPDEWRPIPGSLEAIARLTQSGWRVVVATNQSGVGRGLMDMASLNAIHAKMHKAVNLAGGRIEAVFYCPDTAESQSPCRKPNPGMFFAIAERLNVTLDRAPCVGDSLRDLQAAAALEPILSWCSPAKARKRAPTAGFRREPPCIRIWPRWRTRCVNDLSALARLPHRSDPRHAAIRDHRPRHVSPAAACALSRDLRAGRAP